MEWGYVDTSISPHSCPGWVGQDGGGGGRGQDWVGGYPPHAHLSACRIFNLVYLISPNPQASPNALPPSQTGRFASRAGTVRWVVRQVQDW